MKKLITAITLLSATWTLAYSADFQDMATAIVRRVLNTQSWAKASSPLLTSRSKATQVSAATAEDMELTMGAESQAVFKREEKHGAHNYHPLPVALCRAKGCINLFRLDLTILNFEICGSNLYRSENVGC